MLIKIPHIRLIALTENEMLWQLYL